MTDRSGENPVHAEYAAAFVRATADQAVAEAEAAVADAWLTELESLRRTSERSVATAVTARRISESTLREARRRADPQAVALARERAVDSRAAMRKSVQDAQLTLRLISRELAALTAARREHARTARENLSRLRSAHLNIQRNTTQRNTLGSGVGEAHRQ